jgi:beta-N-acetylhexosaminidase
MTDDISMQALAGTVAKRSRAALDAGCDVILHCNGEAAEMQAVAAEAGRMSPSARSSAAAALDWRRAPTAIDIAALEDEFRGLMTGQG